MKTSEKLLSMLMVFEGLRLTAYEDAAGVLTIGYGHTKGVRRGDTISDYYAKELLKQDASWTRWCRLSLTSVLVT